MSRERVLDDEFCYDKLANSAVPHQTGVLLSKNGNVLAEFTVISVDNGNQNIIRLFAPGRKIKEVSAVSISLVGDDNGLFWAIDGRINKVDPNGIRT